MKIGDKGYLIEVGMKGIREDKWLKPPLYELVEIQQCKKVTHFRFKSANGNHTRTITSIEFQIGEWAFCDTPEPISRSEQPRLRARIADISKHSHGCSEREIDSGVSQKAHSPKLKSLSIIVRLYPPSTERKTKCVTLKPF